MSKTTAERQADIISQQLVGGCILNAFVSPEAQLGQQHFGFSVQTKTGKTLSVWVLSDPEGNGPGFLDIASD